LVSLPDGVNFGCDAKFARVQMSSLCSRNSNLNCQSFEAHHHSAESMNDKKLRAAIGSLIPIDPTPFE
jgi:hypothetical protein